MDETRRSPLFWETKNAREAMERILEMIDQDKGMDKEVKETLMKKIYRSRGE